MAQKQWDAHSRSYFKYVLYILEHCPASVYSGTGQNKFQSLVVAHGLPSGWFLSWSTGSRACGLQLLWHVGSVDAAPGL